MNGKIALEILEDILPSNSKKAGANLNHLNCECPFCGKDGKFYINYQKAFLKNNKGKYKPSWDCKSCGESGTIVKLLLHLDRIDIISEEVQVDVKKPLEKIFYKIEDKEDSLDLEAKNEDLPNGFKRIKKHPYLEGRGYVEKDYKHFSIGYTKDNYRLKGYVIFPIIEDGDVKGYLGRSNKNKEEVDNINQRYKKEGSNKRYLRWKNSYGTEFSKLLYGLIDTTDNVETAIIVEGATDVHNVTRLLNIYEGDTRCFGTFGKKISDVQLQKLINIGVKNLIIMFDPEEIDALKRYSLKNMRKFNTKVVYLGDKDPGDLNYNEINEKMSKAEDPTTFKYTKLKKLKI